MSSTNRINKIREKLMQALAPTQLEIFDDSHKHLGHAGYDDEGSHFTLIIASPYFKNKNLVECHQLVYQALGTMVPNEIHALQIKVK